jgi:hypothetical protein
MLPVVILIAVLTCRVLVVRALAARELTKMVAALKDVVEPVKALAAIVERDCREDVREAVEMKPAVPRPCVVDVRESELMYVAVPRPWTVLAMLAGSRGTAPLMLEMVAFEADKKRVIVDPIVMVGGKEVAWMYQRFVDPA